jgi:hypothetical protein
MGRVTRIKPDIDYFDRTATTTQDKKRRQDNGVLGGLYRGTALESRRAGWGVESRESRLSRLATLPAGNELRRGVGRAVCSIHRVSSVVGRAQ